MMLSGKNIVEALASRRLALSIFFGICAFGVYGSIVPQRTAALAFEGASGGGLAAARFVGLIDTYRSPLFLVLLTALATNLLACTGTRLLRRVGAQGSWRGRLGGVTPLLDLLLHLSVAVVLVGGAGKGIWGETLTKNVHVGQSTGVALDWRLGTEVALGFTVLVQERLEEYYPARVRVGVKRTDTGEKIALVEIAEGGPPVAFGGTVGTLELLAFARDAGRASFRVSVGRRQERFDLATGQGGRAVAAAGPFNFTLVAFRDDIKSVRSLIRIASEDGDVREEWLEPNSSAIHRGTSIFQTAWGTDEFGNPYVGLQFVRDPWAPVFWAGCVALAFLVPVYFAVRHRRGRGVTAPVVPGPRECPRRRGEDRQPRSSPR